MTPLEALGTGRFSFETHSSITGVLSAGLFRRQSSDSSIEALRFYQGYDSLYLDRVEISLPDLIDAYFGVQCIRFLYDCSLDILRAIARSDPDYPFEDVYELRYFTDQNRTLITALRPNLARNIKARFIPLY